MVLAFISLVTFVKLFNLSVFERPHLENENSDGIHV